MNRHRHQAEMFQRSLLLLIVATSRPDRSTNEITCTPSYLPDTDCSPERLNPCSDFVTGERPPGSRSHTRVPPSFHHFFTVARRIEGFRFRNS
jgi:hypothetical protein